MNGAAQTDIEWAKVPSHVSRVGNGQADALANRGRPAHPIYPAADDPKGRAARLFTTSQSPPRPAKHTRRSNGSQLSGTVPQEAWVSPLRGPSAPSCGGKLYSPAP